MEEHISTSTLFQSLTQTMLLMGGICPSPDRMSPNDAGLDRQNKILVNVLILRKREKSEPLITAC